MENIKTLIINNILCLEQGIDLLDQLEDAVYLHTNLPYYGSSIGDHLRHGLEHYLSFLVGLEGGHIDYDARPRDKRISTSRAYAIEVSQRIIGRLKQIPPDDKSLLVKMDCDPDSDESDTWSVSSVVRDLQYLQAHTIHHYALIAMILRLQGYDPGPDFGVAPSTLKYRRQQEQSSQ